MVPASHAFSILDTPHFPYDHCDPVQIPSVQFSLQEPDPLLLTENIVMIKARDQDIAWEWAFSRSRYKCWLWCRHGLKRQETMGASRAWWGNTRGAYGTQWRVRAEEEERRIIGWAEPAERAGTEGNGLRGGDGRTGRMGRGASGAGSAEALRKHLALVVGLWGAAVWMVVTERGGVGGGQEGAWRQEAVRKLPRACRGVMWHGGGV